MIIEADHSDHDEAYHLILETFFNDDMFIHYSWFMFSVLKLVMNPSCWNHVITIMSINVNIVIMNHEGVR